MAVLERARSHARRLKRDTLTLYFLVRDPRTPWYARAIAAAVVAYALSPFDLIPDFVPVLGYVDDLLIVPLGIALVLKLTPNRVLADCRLRAQAAAERPVSLAGAAFIIGVWLLMLLLVVRWAFER